MNREEAEAFLVTEARLLDQNRLYEWLDLVTDDFVYWIPVNEEASDPRHHISILHNNKNECRNRIFRVLESGLNHTQDPPSRTVRFVSNVEVGSAGAGDEEVLQCNLLLYELRSGFARRDAVAATPKLYAAHCEYATVRVEIDSNARGPRLRITDMSTGVCSFLDPLELESIAWVRHKDLEKIVEPSYRESVIDSLVEQAAEEHLVTGVETMLREQTART